MTEDLYTQVKPIILITMMIIAMVMIILTSAIVLTSREAVLDELLTLMSLACRKAKVRVG